LSKPGIACLLLLAVAGCRKGGEPAASPDGRQSPPSGSASAAQGPVPFQDLENAELLRLNQRLTGDLDAIAKRRVLRALVPYSRTFYYLDGVVQQGLAFDALQELGKALGERFRGTVAPRVVIIPTSRERLLPALAEGYGDIAIGGFTVTEARRQAVDFSTPTATAIRNVVVTGPGAPPLRSLDDLAGKEVRVRASSSYHEDLVALSARLVKAGKRPIRIQPADERLEDEDVLQMVDAGIFTITVVKEPYAKYWAQLYRRLAVHGDLALRTDGETAWAMRKNTPALRQLVDAFVRGHRVGTVFGNMMVNRYLGSTERLRNPKAQDEMRRFREAAPFFRKYAGVYGFPWLAVVAQAYQESRLNQSVRSRSGAIGVMQLLPATGRTMRVGDIRRLDNNVHAGVKYMRYIVDQYFKDAPMDKLDRGLFAFASYNAGPARVAGLRKKAAASGLDPNRWFNNVELIAAREIGRETVDYVGNIYKYYTVYTAVAAEEASKKATKSAHLARRPAHRQP